MGVSTVSVCHCISGMSISDGGPSLSVASLADAQADFSSLNVFLVSHALQGIGSIECNNPRVQLRIAPSSSRLYAMAGLLEYVLLKKLLVKDSIDIMHSHGIWHPTNHWAIRLASRYHIPVVCQPRGMLEPWALNASKHKKRIAMALYQGRDLDAASLFIATSDMEYEGLRRFGIRQPIAVIPNGVSCLPSSNIVKNYPPERKLRTALFLSRLHPKKGVVELVEAWNKCLPSGWILKIAGPDEGGHLSKVRGLIERLGLQESIFLCGEVVGHEKEALFSSADLFVLPTFSENFGLVVAEALSYGIPVITTKGAPWHDLIEHRCGWWIDIGVVPLMEALREATAMDELELRKMGYRGRYYVKRYNWTDIARQTEDVYLWILGKSPQPNTVRVD